MTDSDVVYEALRFIGELTELAERNKRSAEDSRYWQGVCDTCRKLNAILCDLDLYSELFRDDGAGR